MGPSIMLGKVLAARFIILHKWLYAAAAVYLLNSTVQHLMSVLLVSLPRSAFYTMEETHAKMILYWEINFPLEVRF